MAYLNKEQEAYGKYVDHIEQYINECREGKHFIYTSTLTIAEITRKRLVKSSYGTFSDFLNEYQGAIIQVSADPIIMQLASEIKNLSYVRSKGKRDVGTADAIHLASALVLQESFGVPVKEFHTFDNGKSKGTEGRAVPLLDYHLWCDECKTHPIAQKVIGLSRNKPDHPDPRLF